VREVVTTTRVLCKHQVAGDDDVFGDTRPAAEAELRTRNELIMYSALALVVIVMILFISFHWRANSWLVLTARAWPDGWGLRTADLLSRLRLAPAVEIAEPDDALVRAVLVKHFIDRQLMVDTSVVEYLAMRIERSLDAARQVVELLRSLDDIDEPRQLRLSGSGPASSVAVLAGGGFMSGKTHPARHIAHIARMTADIDVDGDVIQAAAKEEGDRVFAATKSGSIAAIACAKALASLRTWIDPYSPTPESGAWWR
jgi:hypothetical protein